MLWISGALASNYALDWLAMFLLHGFFLHCEFQIFKVCFFLAGCLLRTSICFPSRSAAVSPPSILPRSVCGAQRRFSLAVTFRPGSGRPGRPSWLNRPGTIAVMSLFGRPSRPGNGPSSPERGDGTGMRSAGAGESAVWHDGVFTAAPAG